MNCGGAGSEIPTAEGQTEGSQLSRSEVIQLSKGAGQAPESWLFLVPDQAAHREGEGGCASPEALLPFPTQS